LKKARTSGLDILQAAEALARAERAEGW
jgi:hypothetical protein